MSIRVVSLFTGSGGFDFGFEEAGYSISTCIEIDNDCVDTIRSNRKWSVINEDIRLVTADRVTAEAGLRKHDLDVLIGGPPCQPFSKASQWVNGTAPSLSDPRGYLVAEMLRLAEKLLPKVILIENVPGFITSSNGNAMLLLDSLFSSINKRHGTMYSPVWKILDAADFGVPQHRKRVFIVAQRDGKELRFSAPTHGSECNDMLDIAIETTPYITAWDAIGKIPSQKREELIIRGKWGDLLSSIPEGMNYQWHTRKGGGLGLFGYRTRYWAFLLKLAKNRSSWTLPANPGTATGPFHWKNRRLSIEEMAALQTFPTGIKFAGTYRSVQRQIGNAVPSLMSEILARSIGEQFFNLHYSEAPKLLVNRMVDLPPPDPVQPVPDKYHRLIGKHPDHPGNGKGPGAITLKDVAKRI